MAVTYYNIPQVVDKLTDVAYEHANITAGHRFYDKLINGNLVRNYFYAITGSSNLTLNRNNTNLVTTADVNKVKLSVLTNSFDSTFITTNYFDKTVINANYYDKTSVDALLNVPSKPHYGGFISSAVAINGSTGCYTFTVSKLGTGSYQILYDVASGSGNYTVVCNPRVSTASCCTYSSQSATSVTMYTFNRSGTTTDIGFSFIVIY